MSGKQCTRPEAAFGCDMCQLRTVYRKHLYACGSCCAIRCRACAKVQTGGSQRAARGLCQAVGEALAPLVSSPLSPLAPPWSQPSSSLLPPASPKSQPQQSSQQPQQPVEQQPTQQQLTQQQQLNQLDQEVLRDALRALPAVSAATPLLWIPRSVRAPIAALLRQLLATATRLAGAVEGDSSAEIAHLLLRHAPYLLLRGLPGEPDEIDECKPAHRIIELIRCRVKLARAESWLELVANAAVDAIASTKPASARMPQGPSDPLGPARAQAAAIRARTGSLRGASSLLTGGASVPPGPATDAQIKTMFATSEPPDEDCHELQMLLRRAAQLPAGRRLKVTLRLVGRQVAGLKPAAGPGPSGWRNSHVQCLYAEPAGPEALASWVQAWASGSVSPWLASIWTGALARPFWKDEHCTKIRPVLCTEVLLKVAMGVITRGAETQIARGVGPHQYGAGRSAGAAAEIGEVRAAVSAFPHRAVLSLDIKNAFGEVSWQVALRAVLQHAPMLAGPLTCMWQAGRTAVHTAAPDGSWTAWPIHGSLIQGNLEAQPIFCLVMAMALDAVRADPKLAEWTPVIRHWQYVDDWVIQAPTESVPALMASLGRALDTLGLPLQLAKCKWHVPMLRGMARTDWPPSATKLLDILSESPDGITMLGTEACRELSTPLYVGLTCPAQCTARLERACTLSDRVQEMMRIAPPAGAKQAAFALARCLISHALDFDASVLPCSLVLPHASILDQKVLEIIALTMDVPTAAELPPEALAQLNLPQRLGGLQVDLPSHTAPLARAACLMERGPALRLRIAEWAEAEKVQLDPKQLDGIAVDEEAGLMQHLADRGIDGIHGTGRPASTSVPAAPTDPLRPQAPDKHLLSGLLRHSADVRYAKLFAAAPAAERIRLLSASGPSAGSSMVAPLCTAGVHMTDWQWTSACRWRLGLMFSGRLGSCCNQRRDGTCCQAPLDREGNHAADCPCGPLRNQRHDELAEIYADILEEAGGIARREVHVEELSGVKEAVLDVWAYGIQELPDLLLDITVRHPRAARYRPAAETTAAAAASKAESEKLERYPAANGREVWPVAHETWGRLGPAAEQLLQLCASAAARRAHRRGKVSGGELKRWRARLDGCLQRSVAMQQASATRGLPGRRPVRARPLDLHAFEASCDV
jgi:hypothetical protein